MQPNIHRIILILYIISLLLLFLVAAKLSGPSSQHINSVYILVVHKRFDLVFNDSFIRK